MGWILLSTIFASLAFVTLVISFRRVETHRLSRRLSELAEAKQKGTHRARLQYPHVDLSCCLGCGSCIKACPEEGVLELIHGQAVVIHGARCVGHGLCATTCPVGAISLTLGDVQERRDIPALTDQLEVRQVPGLFLAGEVSGYALIRTAITHGTAVAKEVANRLAGPSASTLGDDGVYDLIIVGAGPAGIAASLQAKSDGLHFLCIDQEQPGGTVAKYPRRKLVMTQPVVLPLHGPLKKTSYSKEELLGLWTNLVQEHQLPVRTDEEFTGVEAMPGGGFQLRTSRGEYVCHHVCLALGRRGTPRKLGVRGEELHKVAYSLIDAESYQGRRILVVGGGDSAIEAALGLAEQPGNHVTLSYRQAGFFRLKARNEARLAKAIQDKRLKCLLSSHVREILDDRVHLRITQEGETPQDRLIPNDDVFVMIGGIPPFKLLEQCGVSFDPADRPAPPPLGERGTGLYSALIATLVMSVAAAAWTYACRSYYALTEVQRPLSDLHRWLRPAGWCGLGCGVAATLLIGANLAYLLRRTWPGDRLPGSLTTWMTSHIVTGILALLLVLMHSAMAPRNTLGGHACLALGLLVITGAIGRYFYSFVPRAANGKELALEELHNQIAAESTEWDRFGRGFGDSARQQIHQLVANGRWHGTFLHRLIALLVTNRSIKQMVADLKRQGREQGLSPDQLDRLESMAVKAYRTALVSAHCEDLRAILNTWRFFHRWIALLMLLLAVLHIFVALRYARIGP